MIFSGRGFCKVSLVASFQIQWVGNPQNSTLKYRCTGVLLSTQITFENTNTMWIFGSWRVIAKFKREFEVFHREGKFSEFRTIKETPFQKTYHVFTQGRKTVIFSDFHRSVSLHAQDIVPRRSISSSEQRERWFRSRAIETQWKMTEE